MESDWTIKLQNLKSKITTLAACVRFDINVNIIVHSVFGKLIQRDSIWKLQ